MSYWIMIFTQHPLEPFRKADLLRNLREVHFATLCAQFGLDPALIQPALDQLAVEIAEGDPLPLFYLRYQPNPRPPIVVTGWDLASEAGAQLLADVIEGFPMPFVKKNLEDARLIYSMELIESQLDDLGLLLAYEIARWVMRQVGGIMLGLDRAWYRLNAYQAFIPLSGVDI